MAGRLVGNSRFLSTGRALRESLKEPLKQTPEIHTAHEANPELWKKLFFFVACPAMLVSYINVAIAEEHERPEFKKYSHLRIRNKEYPWRDGVKTLFHNPHRNALPDGYEDLGGH